MKFPACLLAGLLAAAVSGAGARDVEHSIIVSVPDQKMIVLHDGVRVAEFAVSTSKFGLGDRPGSYMTPLGAFEVAEKIGTGAPAGAVFKSRRQTGEVLRPNSKGRDPIVTRILWLRGLETRNRNATSRGIYIHGTPVERLIGKPASFGCVRMRSKDVVALYRIVGVGAKVAILNTRVDRKMAQFADNRLRGGSAG